ncbi:MAG: multidrug ABC transporter substrate-binding protein [Syntrophus sp. SKADARSKE-3]|nr:multidrug ABC transporter substrate-binding protein [Syntrophus sp. SKADARSKE-3]
MIWNAVLLSLRGIRRNPMRSVLTLIGIIVGVAAVITMVNTGSGAALKIKMDISSMGSRLLMIWPSHTSHRMVSGKASELISFKAEDAEAIISNITSVEAASPEISSSGKAIYGNRNWKTHYVGTTNDYFRVNNYSMLAGREFTDGEVRHGDPVCILGGTVCKNLFGSQNPLGERIRLEKVSCEIIGILEIKGRNTLMSDPDDVVILPMRTFQRRISGNQSVHSLEVSIKEGMSMKTAQADIRQLLRDRRHVRGSDKDNFEIMDFKEITGMLTKSSGTLTSLLGAVAAISLLIGGIGIMNIMLASVTERTREIGIRLAIGAFPWEVMIQFLIEAITLSVLGGSMGIVVALASTLWLSTIMHVPFVFSKGILLLSVLFSVGIGVIFGFFPALKAARMDPVEAIQGK